jgi:Secretion system C-terminal sorting domain
MKRKLILPFAFLLCQIQILYSQYWIDMGFKQEVHDFSIDSTHNLLYASGIFKNIGDSLVNSIAVYDGSLWDNVGIGSGDTSEWGGQVFYSIEYFNNQVFVTGDFRQLGGALQGQYFYFEEFAGRWNGTEWLSCGKPNSQPFISKANNQLFAHGYFDTISNKPIKCIARWNGTTWDAFGTENPLLKENSDAIHNVEFYKGRYYFGGNYEINQDWKEIISWDGSQWLALDGGLKGEAWVNDLQVYKGLLFVAGKYFEAAGNVADFLMAWDGNQWIDPFPNVQFTNQVKSLEVIDDKLYIVGGGHYFPGGPSLRTLAHYDGQTFCSFGTGYEYPVILAGYDNRIFVTGGGFITATDTVMYLAEWIGGTTTDICITQPIAIEKPKPKNPKITLSPNPTNGIFVVTLNALTSSEIKIQITDVTGRIVAQQTAAHAGAEGKITVPFDLSHCAPGVYFGRVECGDGVLLPAVAGEGFKVVVE